MIFALALLLPLGCAIPNPRKKPDPPVVAPRLEEPRPLEVGDARDFKFAADGIWYPAPFLIQTGQRLRVTFKDNLAPCPIGAVRYRIGPLEQIIGADPKDFLVTRPGPMSFFFDPVKGAGYRGEVQVTVLRIN